MRNNKGVTLVALVITIIVLLILAGVSLAMLTGDSGILTNADQAKKETNIANAKEAIQMAYMDIKTEVYAKDAASKTFDPDTEMSAIVARYVTAEEGVVSVNYVSSVLTIEFKNGVKGVITYNTSAKPVVSLKLTETAQDPQ